MTWSDPQHDVLKDLSDFMDKAREQYFRRGPSTYTLDLTHLSPRELRALESQGFISLGQTSLTL